MQIQMDMFRYKTLIVDDEPPAVQRLLELLSHFTETFDVIGHAGTGGEAVLKINELKPELVFLDIQMPGMTGFEMLQKLEKIPMIIFCTAFDHYSLKAFETNCVDYLIKPIKLERLQQTVEKLGIFKNSFREEKMISLLKDISEFTTPKQMTSITIRNGKRLVFVKLEDVVYFKAGDKYVSLFIRTGEESITEQSLSQLEEKLPGHFLRVHRAIIINTQFVKEVQTYFNSRYSILMNDYHQSKIITGRNYQTQIKEWLAID